MKILDFKTVSPLFEIERDGEKPFSIRKIDKGKRFRALSQWKPWHKWGMRMTNPATGESFVREIKEVSYLWYHDSLELGVTPIYDWRIIILGDLVEGS